ncbi:MAG: alpha/beta hydrolase [Thermoguttaceae bacterium]
MGDVTLRSIARLTWYNIALCAGSIFLIVYLLLLSAMMVFENSLIYFPMNFPEDDWAPQGITVEEAWFSAADGTKIHGWYAPHEKPRAVVLFCHGNAGNITHRADIVRALNDRVGVAVLVFDYRGFGKSEGKPNEPGVLADARAARSWLAQKTGVSENRIVLMGESLGGAVAVDLATDGARALILENTFSSMPDVAAFHYPWAPVRLLMRTQFNSAAKIRSYHGPLFQSHGDHDSIIPLQFAKRLFDAANEPKRFLLVEGADHNDPRAPQYYDKLREFLDGAR